MLNIIKIPTITFILITLFIIIIKLSIVSTASSSSSSSSSPSSSSLFLVVERVRARGWWLKHLAFFFFLNHYLRDRCECAYSLPSSLTVRVILNPAHLTTPYWAHHYFPMKMKLRIEHPNATNSADVLVAFLHQLWEGRLWAVPDL